MAPHALKALAGKLQQRARDGEITPEEVTPEFLHACRRHPGSLTPVLNATGVVVHTNIGRAPLAPQAIAVSYTHLTLPTTPYV